MAKSKKGQTHSLTGLILETFADYEKHLASPQDVHLYRRKVRDYAEQIEAKLGAPMPAEPMTEENGGADGGAGADDE